MGSGNIIEDSLSQFQIKMSIQTAEKSSYNNALMAEAFFGELKGVAKGTKLLCKGRCGKSIGKPASGYSAFTSHIETCHKETFMSVYAEFTKQKPSTHGPMDAFNPARYASPWARQLAAWTEWIVMGDQPFSICENQYARKYNNINGDRRPIGRHSVAKYVDLIAEKIRDRVKEELPPKFGVYFDGWTHNGEH